MVGKRRIRALFEHGPPDLILTGRQIAEITGAWAVYVHIDGLEREGFLAHFDTWGARYFYRSMPREEL